MLEDSNDVVICSHRRGNVTLTRIISSTNNVVVNSSTIRQQYLIRRSVTKHHQASTYRIQHVHQRHNNNGIINGNYRIPQTQTKRGIWACKRNTNLSKNLSDERSSEAGRWKLVRTLNFTLLDRPDIFHLNFEDIRISLMNFCCQLFNELWSITISELFLDQFQVNSHMDIFSSKFSENQTKF